MSELSLEEKVMLAHIEISALNFYVMALHMFLRCKNHAQHDQDLKSMIKLAKIAAHKEAPGHEEQFVWSVEHLCGLHRNGGDQLGN